MGVLEYWIVDFRALGAARYIGRPKQPTISVYSLVGDEYQLEQFRDAQAVVSPMFPGLKLTAAQIFAMAQC